MDGVVTQAESFMTPDAAYVDEAMISGEPTPAMKKAGDNVLAGTIPSQGKLRMRAKQIGENTALAHIIRMVQEAQGSKAPVQRIVDKAALIFVPAVAAIALITFIFPQLRRYERPAAGRTCPGRGGRRRPAGGAGLTHPAGSTGGCKAACTPERYRAPGAGGHRAKTRGHRGVVREHRPAHVRAAGHPDESCGCC